MIQWVRQAERAKVFIARVIDSGVDSATRITACDAGNSRGTIRAGGIVARAR